VTGNIFLGSGDSITVDQATLTIEAITSSVATSSIQISDPSDGTALTFDTAAANTFAGVISDHTSGSGSVLKTGAGTLTLTGANSYTGGTTLSEGALQIGNSGSTGSLASDIANSTSVVFNRSDDHTYDGVISGTGSVEQAGTGTTCLTGENTYTGGTTISAGTLQLGDGGTSGSILGDVATTGGTLAFNRSDDHTYDGVVSGTGSVEQAGSGTTRLTGAHTHTGGTTITGGILQLGDGGTTGSVSGDIVNDATLALNRSNFVILGNLISGTGDLLHNGSGTTILTAANTFSGATTITGGQIVLGHALGLQNSTLVLDRTNSFDLNGFDATLGGLTGSIDLALGAQGITIGNNGDDTTYDGILSGTGSLTKVGVGTLTLTADQTYTGGTTISAGTLQIGNGGTSGILLGDVVDNGVLAFNRSDDLTFAGAISGSGGVTQNGSGVLSLTGTNSFSGDVTINSGQIRIGSTAQFSANTVVNNVTDGLDLNGFDTTLGGLSGTGDLALGAQTLTVGGNGNPTTYSGALSGTGGLIKTGIGTLVLGGTNTHTGGTTISAGTLQIGNADASGSILGDVATAAGGTLVFNRSDDGLTHSGVISGTGAVVQAGTGTTTFTADHTYTGGTSISAGTLQLGDGGTSGSILGDITSTGGILAFNRSGDFTLPNNLTGTGGLSHLGTGTLTIDTDQTYTGTTTIEVGTLHLGDGGTAGSVAGNILNNGTLLVNRSNDMTLSGIISGSGDLTKQGVGTLTLSAANTFSGDTVIDAGAITVRRPEEQHGPSQRRWRADYKLTRISFSRRPGGQRRFQRRCA